MHFKKPIGDTHLGRRFLTGVPMHRRGEREQSMWTQFRNEMQPNGSNIVVQMGDIFDKAIVPFDVIDSCAQIIEDTAKDHPNVIFVVLAGNHDLSKDTSKVSAFLILKKMLRHLPNVEIVSEAICIDSLGFIPYWPFGSAQEVLDMNHLPHKMEAVFGHWDTSNFGGDNTIPLSALARYTNQVYTGHIHLPGIVVDSPDMKLVKTGSMQPYAHGEEAVQDLYLTMTLTEFECHNPDIFVNKCLRLILKKGEEIPNVECLQLTIKKIDEEGEEVDIDVDFENFDTIRIFNEAMNDFEVSLKTVGLIREQFDKLRGNV